MVAIATSSSASQRSTPNQDAQVRTYRAQLADWVTCPSAKTPEGKAKIQQITAKLDAVKDQIAQASVTPKPTATAGSLGRNIDTYA